MRDMDPPGINWRKSSRCGHGDCIEVGSAVSSNVAVRDSKDSTSGLSLVFRPLAWQSFIAEVKNGRIGA